MGLFRSRKKEVPPEGFSFRIDDIFKIKGRGLVVTGQVPVRTAPSRAATPFGSPTASRRTSTPETG